MDYLRDMNDLRLKPRLLRSLVSYILPEDEKRSSPSPSQLSSALNLIKTHGLLSESLSDPADGKLADAWRSAVDEWVERVLKLAANKMADKCWAGVSLLGITCEECSHDRFVASYSEWFHILLSNIQPLSESQFVKVASCASFSGLLTRLSTLLNVKKDATSLAIKLVQPVLHLLTEDTTDNILMEAVNLLITVTVYFPSALQRHYDKVEALIIFKTMSTKYSMCLSKKLACCMALLPKTRGNQDSWSLMIERVLITINNDLDDAFQGLEQGQNSSEIKKLLIPPGKESPSRLGGSATILEVSGDTEKRIREFLVPRVSTLLQCCCDMLSNSYPAQVHVPIYPLLKVVERLLLMDGTKHDSMLSFTTSLHQELLCSVLPTFHLNALNLLVAIIKGLRSQLLPHAANIVVLISKYFKSPVVPIVRVKLYSIMTELLLSVGSGMTHYLGDLLLTNTFIDVDASSKVEGEVCGAPIEPISKVGNGDSLGYTHKKRKHSDKSLGHNGAETIHKAACRKMRSPLSVQVAAVKALHALLSVGGSLISESWRSNLDLLLIEMISKAYDAPYEQSFFPLEETIVTPRDLQLVAMRLLLASLLSATRVRPRFLSQGLELFRRGKLETGTKLADFCSHALLTMEVLIHPRVLSLSNISEETTMVDKFEDFNNVQPFGGIHNQGLQTALFSRGILHEMTSPNKYRGFSTPSSDENLRPEISPLSSGFVKATNKLTSGEKNLNLVNHEADLPSDSLQQCNEVSERTATNIMESTSAAGAEKQTTTIQESDVEHHDHMIVDDQNAPSDGQTETSNRRTDVVMPSKDNDNGMIVHGRPSLVRNDSMRPASEGGATHVDALSSRIEILRKRLAAEAQTEGNTGYDTDEPSLDSIPDIVDEEPESD